MDSPQGALAADTDATIGDWHRDLQQQMIRHPEDPWQLYAACRGHDPELWYADEGDRFSRQTAVRICSTCIVSDECLDTALSFHDDWGIWGGKTFSERMRTPRRRFRAGPAIKHGTLAGYRLHKITGEEPCQDCVAADERRKERMVCGTRNGYMAHSRMSEAPCQPCRDAMAEHMRRRRNRLSLSSKEGLEEAL